MRPAQRYRPPSPTLAVPWKSCDGCGGAATIASAGKTSGLLGMGALHLEVVGQKCLPTTAHVVVWEVL